MELDITIIIAAVVIAIFAIGFICVFFEIKNAPKLNPDEPFMNGDDGFDPTNEQENVF